jgi:hypothetical protein
MLADRVATPLAVRKIGDRNMKAQAVFVADLFQLAASPGSAFQQSLQRNQGAEPLAFLYSSRKDLCQASRSGDVR